MECLVLIMSKENIKTQDPQQTHVGLNNSETPKQFNQTNFIHHIQLLDELYDEMPSGEEQGFLLVAARYA